MFLENVLHIPDLIYNLFLISQVTRKGLDIVFSRDSYKIISKKKIIGSAPKVNNIYLLSAS